MWVSDSLVFVGHTHSLPSGNELMANQLQRDTEIMTAWHRDKLEQEEEVILSLITLAFQFKLIPAPSPPRHMIVSAPGHLHLRHSAENQSSEMGTNDQTVILEIPQPNSWGYSVCDALGKWGAVNSRHSNKIFKCL